jgi:acyl carrier protein
VPFEFHSLHDAPVYRNSVFYQRLFDNEGEVPGHRGPGAPRPGAPRPGAPRPGAPRPGELGGWLGGYLPDHMVPSLITVLDALPLSPNGKIDYAALPEPVPPPPLPDGGASPSTPIELMVAELWCTLLGIEHIGLDDDLFDAGADSLMATKAAGRLRADLGIELSVPVIFETPTVKGISRAVLDALAIDGLGVIDDRPAVTDDPAIGRTA